MPTPVSTLPREAAAVNSQHPTLMDQPQGQQSLVKASGVALEVTAEPISDPRVFVTRIEQLRETFNIIAPPVQVMGGFTPGYALTAALVSINTSVNEDGQGAETYRDKGFMKDGQRALNRVGLAKVASAAGVKWTPNTGRRDDGTIPYLWGYYAEGLVDTADSGYQIVSGEVEIDFRDGSPQIGGWTPEAWAQLAAQIAKNRNDPRQQKTIGGWSDRRVMQARTMGARYAETKAKNRAIRSMGLQQVYSVEELKKPFLIFKATYVPDMSDPVVRQMVAQRALHGRQMLYPSSAPVTATRMIAAPQAPAGTIDVAASPGAQAAAPQPQKTYPTIVAINEVGTVKSSGEVVSEVVLSDGAKGRTGNAKIVEQAGALKGSKTPVDMITEPSERVPGVFVIIEIVPVRNAAEDLY